MSNRNYDGGKLQMTNTEIYGIMPFTVTSAYSTIVVRDDKVVVEKTKHLQTASGVTSVESVQHEYTRYNSRGELVPTERPNSTIDISV